MAKVYNISKWNIKSWVQTGGTREKCFVENPVDGKLYFFKESIEKFPSEFWSEIISSKVGKELGFDLLDYNIGIYNDNIGCICESMIELENQELEHGINLIKEAIPDFKITERPIIQFEDVEKSFKPYSGYIEKFIEILVFDSIIGNQDRHSENWAIIRSLDITYEDSNREKMREYLLKIHNQYKHKGGFVPFKKFLKKFFKRNFVWDINFSPIYDSGSSLGREITEDRILQFLSDENKIKKYIRKGKAQVRWGEALNHFELLEKVEEKYPEHLNKTIQMVMGNYNKAKVQDIIANINSDLDKEIQETTLSLHRKDLIARFIDSRIQFLKTYIIEK